MFLRNNAGLSTSNQDLVTALRSGHQSALGTLWDRYAQLLFGVAMNYLKDAERSKDAVVELFAALPELIIRHEVAHFRPWLHTVMRNRCLLLLRGDRQHRHVGDEGVQQLVQEPMDDALLTEASLQQLEQAIDLLSDGQRQCIRLFYLERQSYQQTSTQLGLPVEQVRSHLQNGRRNLKLMLTRARKTG